MEATIHRQFLCSTALASDPLDLDCGNLALEVQDAALIIMGRLQARFSRSVLVAPCLWKQFYRSNIP